MSTYTPYIDTSSEDASIHGEDESFLEKPAHAQQQQHAHLTSTRRRHRSRLARSASCLCSAAAVSCAFSILTAALLVLVLLALTRERSINEVILRPALGAAPSLPPHEQQQGQRQEYHRDPVGTTYYHCGKTPVEAKELGCAFDIMSFAWTPPACYDHAVSQAIIKKTGPWIFYLDHNATQPIPDDLDALSREPVVWTEHSYHISHCTYAWERVHRAYLDTTSTRLVPSELGSINHTLHCIGLVNSEQSPKKMVNAVAYMVFDSCTNLN